MITQNYDDLAKVKCHINLRWNVKVKGKGLGVRETMRHHLISGILMRKGTL